MRPGGATAGPAARPRLTERHVLALGLAASAGFLVAAALAAVTAIATGGSPWATIHLALAGAASVAIGTFMPHFAVTLAGTRPRSATERLFGIGLLAVGAAAVVIGVTVVGGWMTGAGAAGMLAGLAIVALQTFTPTRDPLARRHHIVTVTYGAALLQLAIGVVLGALGSVGVPAVVAAWASIRPAHAWLTLFGAISLTIFATLVYLAPTVLGARIRPSRSLLLGAAGMLVGPPLAAIGFAFDARPLAVLGMAVTLAGALGQIGYLADVYRRRGPFTTEHDWRRVSVAHLVAGAGWFTAAVATALVGVVTGDALRGWSIGLLAVPMIAGWMLQELIGSWTHLAPSVTPGTASDHARQRRILAGVSRTRIVTLNVGVALAWTGAWLGAWPVALGGGLLVGLSAITAVVLLVRALAAGRY